ncbi:acetyl-CoA C-acetyltransferase [Sphingopyxis panaciterrae]|uniref:acetyl-CoA C-acetyltransferase n=1 Tax=Sphingopyxis panaciterrae TaxID=363841 RepID=UPI00141DEFE6|nr:acetyl-CoA C-acetyltransferase [Sphingopyxis panaciterrae]NIJ37601.1 acetyl-CoA C-acetyltransferase [Sphingopyxis panaciterrae]
MPEAYIVAAVRTGGGRKGGRLREWHPVDLAAKVLGELVRRTDTDPALIDDVILGCVGQLGGQAANVARNAVLSAGFPETVPGTTVDRQCGSSQQALHFAAQAVMSGTMDVVLAGGVESMTRVPLSSAISLAVANGYDHPDSPRIKARYAGAELNQFAGAEVIAAKYGLTRETLDRFAHDSHSRAAQATASGAFRAEILPLPGVEKSGDPVIHDSDEGIRADANLADMATLKPLREGGNLTAATSSQISDGASGVMVVSEAGLKRLGVPPLARVHHMTVIGASPVTRLDAPIPATVRALERTGLNIGDIDLYEVNEAFASIPLAWLRAMEADPDRLNVNGGAISLGHPLGASGTKLMSTLIYALKARGGRYGLQVMCEGGGLANLTIVERL